MDNTIVGTAKYFATHQLEIENCNYLMAGMNYYHALSIIWKLQIIEYNWTNNTNPTPRQ